MDNRIIEKNGFQNINTKEIYFRNAVGAVITTDNIATYLAGGNDGSSLPAYAINTFFSFFTLPFTAILGAGFKTALDVNGRVPLLLDDVNNMLETLERLESEKDYEIVDRITRAILSYNSCSTSSKKLQMDLKNITTQRDKEITALKSEKRNEILECRRQDQEEKLAQFIKKENITFFKPTINIFPNYHFTKEENEQIEEHTAKKSAEIMNDSLTKIINLISEYLKAEHNSGKGLQHVILEVMRPIMNRDVLKITLS